MLLAYEVVFVPPWWLEVEHLLAVHEIQGNNDYTSRR